MEVQGNVTPNTSLLSAKAALSDMVSKLCHLDLTDHAQYADDIVAGGGYGDVYIGHIDSKYVPSHFNSPDRIIKVAIKRLRIRLGNDTLVKSLAREMGIWAKLNHVNILPFLGFILKNEYPLLVSEWIDNGTVIEYMRNNPVCDIINLALGIARGMEYLHKLDIVHSDLKSANTLIHQSGEPLICDFGLSRMLDSSQSYYISSAHDDLVLGSLRWMAIELHNPEDGPDPKHSKESDVWAYGMTLYEIITKEVPYSQCKRNFRVLFAVMSGELPERPKASDVQHLLQPLWSICESCWKIDPERRTTMARIARLLEQQKQSFLDESSSPSDSVEPPQTPTLDTMAPNSIDSLPIHSPNTTPIAVTRSEALDGSSEGSLSRAHMHGQVTSIAVAPDEQLAWEAMNGNMSSLLVEMLERNENASYKELRNSLHKILVALSEELLQSLNRKIGTEPIKKKANWSLWPSFLRSRNSEEEFILQVSEYNRKRTMRKVESYSGMISRLPQADRETLRYIASKLLDD